MARRGRSRKQNTRMDAAIDAMKPYGFSVDVVKKVMNALLKEYGGDDGYPFIELDGYKVLLEVLIERSTTEELNQEDRDKGETSMKDDLVEDEGAGSTSGGPSCLSVQPVCSEIVRSASQTDDDAGNGYLLPAAGGDGRSWKDIGLDQTMVCTNTDRDSQSGTHRLDVPLSSPPLAITPPPQQKAPTQRRRPCYGWISDDDDDNVKDDFIVLTPALQPVTPSLSAEAGNSSSGKKVKRKSRWDLKPEDV